MPEIFKFPEAEAAYKEFPVTLPTAEWQKLLDGMVDYLDRQAAEEKLKWQATAVARKARDVLIATLTDMKMQTLLACLMECEPLFDHLHEQARKNIQKGKNSEAAFAANGMMNRLKDAMNGLKQ